MNESPSSWNKRTTFILVGVIDAVLGAVLLLIWFGFLPIDPVEFGVPRWILGLLGAFWFFSGTGVVAYQLARVDQSD